MVMRYSSPHFGHSGSFFALSGVDLHEQLGHSTSFTFFIRRQSGLWPVPQSGHTLIMTTSSPSHPHRVQLNRLVIFITP